MSNIASLLRVSATPRRCTAARGVSEYTERQPRQKESETEAFLFAVRSCGLRGARFPEANKLSYGRLGPVDLLNPP